MIESGLDGMQIHSIKPNGPTIGDRLLLFVNGPKHGETQMCDLRLDQDEGDPEPHMMTAINHDDSPAVYRLSSVIEVFGAKVQLAVLHEYSK